MGEDVNTMMHDALERQRFEQAVASLCLLDDPFMTVVFQDNLACVDLVIQIVLNNPNLHATRVITQDTIQNLHGHSVRLDIHALADGQEFNIEIQRAAGGAARRRARYNGSIMDAAALQTGEDYDRLPETYVIFITETDVLQGGQPIYHIQRRIDGTNEPFDDGSHIIYVNSSIHDRATPLGRLMHDFRCTRAEDMYYKVLAERVGHFKGNVGGDERMSNQLWDAYVRDYIVPKIEQRNAERCEQALMEGKNTERLSSIKNLMQNLKFSAEKAMEALSIPKSEWARYKAML